MRFELRIDSGPDGLPMNLLADYFKFRSFFKCHGGCAEYEDPDTGVSFAFEWHSGAHETKVYAVLFKMSFNRPSFFAYEAAEELQGVFRHFPLTCEFTGKNGSFDRDAFIQFWQKGNKRSIQGVELFRKEQNRRKNAEESVAPFLPEETLLRLWRWNYGRGKLKKELGTSNHVAKIKVIRRGNELYTCAFWTDGESAVIPPVDVVMIVRRLLAPRKFCLLPVPDSLPLSWSEAEELFLLCSRERIGDAVFLHDNSPAVQRHLMRMIRQLKNKEERFEMIPLSTLIDSENRSPDFFCRTVLNADNPLYGVKK